MTRPRDELRLAIRRVNSLFLEDLSLVFFFSIKKDFVGAYIGSSGVKNPPANAGDTGSIPGSGRSPGEGNGYPLQYSCLENPTDRGAWRATVQEATKCQTRLSD